MIFYKRRKVIICTSNATGFIYLICRFETGKKLHQAASAIQELRQKSDALCLEYGLSVCQPKEQRTKPLTAGEYHSAVRGGSWKMRLINTIDECMRYAKSKEMFIEMMESEGYAVKWTDTRKNITYTTPDGKKCRDDRLHEQKYLKERMELELRIRQEIIAGRTQTAKQTDTANGADAQADTQQLSADSAGFGRTVRDSDYLTGADENTAAAKPQSAHTHQRAADQVGIGASEQEPLSDTADLITGWEQERAFFFAAEASAANLGMVTDMDSHSPNLAGIGSSVVQLGRAVERLESPVPVTDATTKPQLPAGKKKKLAVGQKEDDHSGHDFEMKM